MSLASSDPSGHQAPDVPGAGTGERDDVTPPPARSDRLAAHPRTLNGARYAVANRRIIPSIAAPTTHRSHATIELRESEVDSERATRLTRSGAVVLLLYLGGYALYDFLAHRQLSATVFALHLVSLCVIAVCFSLTFFSFFHRHWRALTLAFNVFTMAMLAAIGIIDAAIDPLRIALSIIMIGTGAVTPWSMRWQTPLNASAIGLMVAAGHWSGVVDPSPLMNWLAFIAAALLSQIAVHIGAGYRRQMAGHIAMLHETHRQLQVEMEARERAHRQFRDSEATLRKIFEVGLDGITITRVSDGRYIDVHQAYVDAGFSKDEVLGARDVDLNVWADKNRRTEFLVRLGAEQKVQNMEVEFRARDGTIIPTLISATMVELGGELCIVSFTRDIRGLKKTEHELLVAREETLRQVEAVHASEARLRESEAMLRKLFEANLDSITIVDVANGRYLDVNEEFVRYTGFSREEIIGHGFQDVNLWAEPDQLFKFLLELASKQEIRNAEATFRMKDGRLLPSLVSAVVLELGGKLCTLTITRDITALKHTEHELVDAREAALAASRAKSEFLSSMSHEIRTPMNAILGMADLLAETALDTEQRRYTNTVVSNGHALLELIDGILDLARVESGRLHLEAIEFDARELSDKVLETLAFRAHEKGVELMARYGPGVPATVVGDPLRLRQILVNLVGNAIKFTSHGQVLVTIEPDSDSDALGALKFAVADTGIGIARDKLGGLFSVFTQADSSTTRKYGGSGLGLAIAYRLVALMQGTIDVESEVGKGSKFSFTARVGVAPRLGSETAAEERSFAGETILIVDDNPGYRSILTEILAARGLTVAEADSGEDALAMIESARAAGAAYRVIVIDGKMPAMTGYDMALGARARTGDSAAFVMMLSADDLTTQIARLRAAGFENYVAKPVRRSELLAAIARAMSGVSIAAAERQKTDAAVAAAAAPKAIIVDRALKILIADDSPDNRALVAAYLKKTPYLLDQVENGRQAINTIKTGRYDLVLMDIQMPEVDGYAATRAIRQWQSERGLPRTPIIALTASALDDAFRKTKEAGCDAHVVKPVKKATLLQAISDAVTSEPPRNESPRARSNRRGMEDREWEIE